jgi:hypothetical protein
MSFRSSPARAAAAGFFVALSLAACGPRAVEGHLGCELPPPASDPLATLVSPAKGATGVPVTVGTISFTVADAALKQGETLEVGGLAFDFKTTQIATANGVMSATVPALQPHTQYNVTVFATLPPERQTQCVTMIFGYLGSFTTQ